MKELVTALVAALSLTLSGCAALNEAMGLPVNKGNGYVITHDKKIKDGSVHIEYQDRAFLEAEKRQEMQNRMAPESEMLKAIESLPNGGMVIVQYEALTVGAANTKWLEYVVLADGKEIYRRKGSERIPNIPKDHSSVVRFWWNIDTVALPSEIDESIDFVVINNLQNVRDTFTISRSATK